MAKLSIDQLVNQASRKYGVPAGLIRSVIHFESGGNPKIRSPAGAVGLMQLMPATAAGLGVTDPTDPAQNIDGGTRYLAGMIRQFGSVPLALAAYNAGPGAVRAAGNKIPNYPETQAYVRNVTSLAGVDGASATSPVPVGQAAVPSAGEAPSAAIPGVQPNQALLSQFYQASAPTDAQVEALQGLGGMAARAAQAGQEETPLAQSVRIPQMKTSTGKPTQGKEAPPPIPIVPVSGLKGDVPMHVGGQNNTYPNLQFASQVDWQHVNQRLLRQLQ